MNVLDKLQNRWARQRKRLELESRVLAAVDDREIQQALDKTLYRCRLPSRVVGADLQVVELLERGNYSLVVVTDELARADGCRFLTELRKRRADVDVVIGTARPTAELAELAFAHRVRDVITWPASEQDEAGKRIQVAVRANVDQRMRSAVLGDLRGELARLTPDSRAEITSRLELRLSSFKRWIGGFDHVLVVEGRDQHLRYLSENLLVQGLHVEGTDSLEAALDRAANGALHLVLAKVRSHETDLTGIVKTLRRDNPLADLGIVSQADGPELGVAALRSGAVLYMCWPPDELERAAERVAATLQLTRSERLLDCLLTGLFVETRAPASSADLGPAFEMFRELAGIRRPIPISDDLIEEEQPEPQGVRLLDTVLDDMLAEEPQRQAPPVPDAPLQPGVERRAYVRVAENQFVRFRPQDQPTSLLAYLGDISEGGVFIRTADLLPRDTQLEVDVNLEHDGQGYLIRCQGVVAWVAREPSKSPCGLGFGVRFIDVPGDVKVLLQRVVRQHTR